VIKKIPYKFLGFLITFLFLNMAQVSFGQWTFDIVGTVKKEETKKRLGGATITIKKNGTVWKTLTSPDNGKFEVSLLPDADYMIEFSKPGHVTKKIQVSSKGVPPEDAKYGLEFPLELNLFEKIDGLDVSVLNQPIAKVKYDAAIGYPDFDKEYTKSIQKELERLKKELAEKLKLAAAEKKAKQAEYDKAISSGDKNFNSEKWNDAKPFYEKAASIFPTETYPAQQLAEIKAQQDKNAELDKAYADAITEADAFFQKKEWENATSNYQKASDLKDKEQYPKDKINEIETILANEEKVNEEYNDAIASADGKLSEKEYEEAKIAYQKASSIKSSEQYPKDKIQEIEKILLEINKNEKGYKDAIVEADNQFNGKEYQKAIDSYNKALGFKPTEEYPKDKIGEATDLLANLKQLQDDYDKYIVDADAAFKNKEYDEAKSNYKEASNIFNNEIYPKDKLAEIESILNAAAKLEEEYNLAINQGDKAFDQEKYELAKTDFEKASKLKSEEEYPIEKLEEIKSILKELADKKAEEDAIALAQKEIDEKYNAFIATADNSFTSKDYENATKNYNAAINVKEDEQYPKDKLEEIEALLEELARKKEEGEAAALAQKEMDDEYNEYIKEADLAFKDKNYDDAKDNYNEAINVKSSEQYPKDKIKEIEALLLALEKKKEEEELAAESELKKREYYDALIDEADAELGGENYQEAIAKYNQALGLIPEEKYPKEKIKEIENILAKNQAEKDNALLAEKEINEKYKKLIIEADNAFGTKDYTKAITKYKAAQNVKVEEKYPQDQLDRIEDILAENARKEEEIKLTNNTLKLKQEQYDGYIKIADADFNGKEYEKAKLSYKLALGVLPEKPYPKNRIDEIDQILAEIANKAKNDKEAELAEKEKRRNYEKLIYAGDRAMKLKKYQMAKDKFNNALSIIPEEKYPKDKIIEIESLLMQSAENTEKIVANNSPSGPRSKINDAKEKEIEAKMAALLNKRNSEKAKVLQKNKADFEHQEEIRVSGGIARTKEAGDQLDDYNDDILALKERGNKYHLENNKTLESTKKILDKAENERIIKADKKRVEANKDLIDYAKADLKFKKNQEKIDKIKVKDHNDFVDDVNKSKMVMGERGDKMRAENKKVIEKLISETEKNEIESKKRSDKLKIDVNKYRAELAKEEEIRISAAVNRTIKNDKEINKIVDDINKQAVKKSKTYKRNVNDLNKFKKGVDKLQQQRIKRADKRITANNKLKEKMEKDIAKQTSKKTKDYYKDVKQLDKFKKVLAKQNLTLQKKADKRRVKSNKEVLKAKENLGVTPKSQDRRYKELKEKLDEEKTKNNDFISDLQAMEREKLLLANTELSNFYIGEKQLSSNTELSNKYAQGITEETIESDNSITIKRTKVTDNHVDVYERVFYTWGGTFFYKNGVNITQALWDKESIEK
jgi:tetratricopeptide (TPR) repeat protein